MKRSLQEDLKRIHTLTYGKTLIEEGFLDNVLKSVGLKKDDKKTDDPMKADLVNDDVNQFYKTIEQSSQNGGLKQQEKGTMTFQKEVESMQIGLMMLDYQLPKHGVDGLFGPETAAAVVKFKTDNNIKDSAINEATLESPLSTLKINSPFGPRNGGNHPGVDLAADQEQIKSPADGTVVDAEIRDDACGGTISVQHGGGFKSRYCHAKDINVTKGQVIKTGDVLGVSGGKIDDPGHGRSTGRHLHFELYKDGKLVNPMDYINKDGLDLTSGVKQDNVYANPDMLNKLIELLKQKGVTSEELKKYIDAAVLTGGGASFTDIDLNTDEGYRKYAEISQKFIDSRKPNLLNITGEMMARGAKGAFVNYKKYVPPELALAQLAAEGGIGNGDPNSRPIRTKNPFNVGNTDSGSNVQHSDVQIGINTYYNLIAKNYLTGGKTANDLVQNFVNKDGNRYASSDYEPVINKIAGEVNRIALTVA
jgi:peptidoglycan hydrolase-like protein with peptidoglycan-binding domain